MTSVGFEHTISASQWPQTYVLDCAATGTGVSFTYQEFINVVRVRV
jgi:hypothetical protein